MEDGTANQDRLARANEHNRVLADIFKHDPIDFDAELSLKGLLDVVAMKRGQVPVSDNFVNSLDEPTREWLASFIREPYTTSPKHSALKFCTSSTTEDLPKAFRVYIRTYETTAGEERERLQAFIKKYPYLHQGYINSKLDSLQGYSEDRTVWGHYIGQTLSKRGPLGRHQDDQERAIADGGKGSALFRWLFFTDLDLTWKVYEFRTFHTPVPPQQLGSDSDIWRSRLDFQEAEYGLVLAADKRGWNSAPGGMPQTSYDVPNELAQVSH